MAAVECLEGDITLEGYIGPISVTEVPGVNTSEGVMGIEGLNGMGDVILLSVPVHEMAKGMLKDLLARCDFLAFRRRRQEVSADSCASTCERSEVSLFTCRRLISSRLHVARLRHVPRPTLGSDPSRILLAARMGSCGAANSRGPNVTLPGAHLLNIWRVAHLAVDVNSSPICEAGRADGPSQRWAAVHVNSASTMAREQPNG
jgi:hypothetical protein